MRGYAVCTEPRSGSNYLGRLLQSTGQLGRPWEFFNHYAVRQSGLDGWPTNPSEQLVRIPEAGGSPNGVYALKVFSSHADEVSWTHWATALPDLRFVYLERRDLLGQAISLVRAEQTGEWTLGMRKSAEAVFRPEDIAAALRRVTYGYARWQVWFARNGLKPVRLIYEDVVAAPQHAVNLVADAVELHAVPPINWSKVDVAVQRDDVTAEWRQRFLDEWRDLALF